MSALFSEKERAATFRHLWIILAQIEQKLGLEISQTQIDEMIEHVYDIDLERIHEIEKITHHDVMAHILAFGEKAESAQKIIHLGATSCYVTDNADVLIYKKALDYLIPQFKKLIEQMVNLARTHKDVPCVGYTHFQVAQPTTIGKRFCLWIQDLIHLFHKLTQFGLQMKLLGIKGATGTQSSFYILFDEDVDKIRTMECLFEEMMGMKSFAVSGQTYSRLQDAELLNIFSEIGACLHKIATDIRLLSHTGELAESFDTHQVGSSAMPHKKNPMLSERICSLSRFLMQQSVSALQTQANQWLERSLDDSAVRRLIMPEAFLTLDSLIHLTQKVMSKIHVSKETCMSLLKKSQVALSLEPILMYLSKNGHDRQKTHEILKTIFQKHPDSLSSLNKSLQEDYDIQIENSFLLKLEDPLFLTLNCQNQVNDFLSQLFLN
jgi:adenylosuccinate lyase